MENPAKILGIVFFVLLMTWVLLAFLKMRKTFSEAQQEEEHEEEHGGRMRRVYDWITIFCCICISISYITFTIFNICQHQSDALNQISPGAVWVMTTLLAIYFKQKSNGGRGGGSDPNRWPLVLILWWVGYGLLFNSIIILVCLPIRSRLVAFFPPADLLNFIILPLSVILCFSVLLSMSLKGGHDEAKQPLLTKNDSGGGGDFQAYECSGIWSKLTFQWMNQIFDKGRKQKLKLSHLPPISRSETADDSYSLLQESLKRQKTKDFSLTRAIIISIWKSLALNGIFAGVNTLSSYLGPLLITNFVEFLSGKDTKTGNRHGYILAFLFFFAKTVESLSERQWFFGARKIGVRVRAALMASIYNTSLSIKYSTTGNGKIINFLDVDVERIEQFSWYFHRMWLLPFQVSLALLILHINLGGAASIAALMVTVIVMVSNIPLANIQEKLHLKIMKAKDSRIKDTAETLKFMRILKLHSWENAYLNKLFHLRDNERSWIKKYLYTRSAIAFLFWTSPTFVSVITFSVCFITKTPLTPGAVLSALATFRILQDPIYNLPELVSMIAQTKVSIDRIEEFIKEEIKQSSPSRERNSKKSDITIEIKPGEYGWEIGSNSRKPTIKIDNKIHIRRGEKIAICGSVGSGKSSFICSIMEEIPRMAGARTKMFGSTAYAPQSAWIQNGTIRENVLFGNKMDTGFYDKVMEACALDKDIMSWTDGNMCLVGERGMNVSGGQKQRIQLARAIYSNSDVYLLDDPFSAVDAHTGGHLFKECLMGLLSEKTVVYVTHQLEFLNSSDLILVMKEGKIVQQGKYEDLIKQADGELIRLIAAHEESTRQVTPSKDHGLQVSAKHQVCQIEIKEKPNYGGGRSSENLEGDFGEKTESGRVEWKIYSKFVSIAYKGILIPVILLCHLLFQGLQMGSSYWITWGTEKEGKVSQGKLMTVFILLSLTSSIFIFGRAVLLSTVAIETAQKLFVDMTTCIFRAPISFFDFTPSSRILNRASADQSVVDTDIPFRLGGLIFALVQLLGIILFMCLVVWPIIFLFIIVLAISFYYEAYYISTATELARMVAVRKAPILHHFSESIAGATTIRCFSQETRFFSQNLALIDDYSRITFHNNATMEWLSIRINFLFNIVFFVELIILVTVPKSTIDPSLAGLATTYGLSLNVLQAWVIWNICNVENKMISVERILQFSRLKSEAPAIIEECRPVPEWPMIGTIELDDLHVRYSSDMPMVLKGLSCIFPGKKKIGVVGRTGSGKSTLIQAFFRVVEPSQGRIIIDGMDITQIGLHDLRSRLSIIPQDPSLFQGTVRTNLDPLQEHTDLDIWEALKRCYLGEIVKKDDRLLDAPVAENGENWSMGQRQLVCLARALLKKRRILMLDEATASVDTATDNVIQKTIREETGNCTVISVAHRIATIIDNDLVLVLDEGKVLEYDSPRKLLEDKTTAFSKLVAEFLRQTNNNHQLVFS